MPITASSGALTYTKAVNNVNANYWFLQPAAGTYNNFASFQINNSQIYLNNFSSSSASELFKLSGLSNPSLSYYAIGGAALAGNMYFASSTVVRILGNQYAPSTQFPYPLSQNATSVVLNLSASTIVGSRQPTRFNPDTNDSFKFYQWGIGSSQTWITAIRRISNGVFQPCLLLQSPYILCPFSGSFSISNNIISGLRLTNSNEEPTVLYTSDVTGQPVNQPKRVALLQVNKTIQNTPSKPVDHLINNWDFAYLGDNLKSSDLRLDSNDNSYFTFYDHATGVGYLAKVNDSGVEQWQRSVSNTRLFGVVLKSNTEIYVVGVTSTGRLWIAEFNDSGTLQWQNEMIGSTAFNNVSSNYQEGIAKIEYDSSNLYLAGTGGYRSAAWFITKVPDDGTVIGNGEYVFSDGSVITYQTSSQTIATSTLSTTSNGYNSSPSGVDDTTSALYTASLQSLNKTVGYP
tara:strand:+ start:886 stop:2262 length:1377 start_codon:yes stop_codon:yes gene_type:complete